MAVPSAQADSTAPPRAAGGLALAAAIVAFGFLASRLLGVVRTTVIASQFGVSAQIDAYNVAFRVPDLIFQILAGATLGSAFIPVFARVYQGEGEDRGWEVASRVLNLVTVATAVLCAVAFVLAPWLVPLTAPDLVLKDKAVELTRLMLLSPLLFAMSGMVTGILNARQRFFLSALAPVLYNLGIIFGAAVLAEFWGLEGLAVGVVLGAAAHLAIQLPGLVQERMRWRPTLKWADPAVQEVTRLMGPRVVGLAAVQFNFVVASFFGSQVGEDAIGILNYGFIIAGLPLAMFGMALSTAVFPRLAELVADGDLDGMDATLSRTLRAIMFMTVPAAVGLFFLRDAAVNVVLQWGAFEPEDARTVAAVVAFYALGIVPQAGVEIHSRGFYAMGDTRTPVSLSVVAVGANIVLSAALWQRFDHEGLAFSLSAASWLEWVLLYYLYRRRMGGEGSGELDAMARFAFSAAVMGLFLAVSSLWYDPDSKWESLVLAVSGTISGAMVYAGMASLFGMQEVREAMGRMAPFLRRKAPTGTSNES